MLQRRSMMSELPPGVRPGTSLSNDTRALILFEANRKHALVALALCLTIGILGGHNLLPQAHRRRDRAAHSHHHGRRSYVSLVWVIVDAFLVAGWVRDQNNLLATELGA